MYSCLITIFFFLLYIFLYRNLKIFSNENKDPVQFKHNEKNSKVSKHDWQENNPILFSLLLILK